MYKPLSLALGLRYIRAKRKNQFISFISFVSIIGIALGVAVLIIVLSVMNGFDTEIKTRILSMVPQVTVYGYGGRVSNWDRLSDQIKQNSEVIAVAPFVETQAMLKNDNYVKFGIIQGIDPDLQKNVSPISSKMIKGSLSDLKKQKFGIVLGDSLASSLGVDLGDKVTVIVPKFSLSPVGMLPHLKQFVVVGMFHSGYQYDDGYGYISLRNGQLLNGLKVSSYNNNSNSNSNNIGEVTGVEVKLDNVYKSRQLVYKLQQQLFGYIVSDWTSQNASFFKALKMEKLMMSLILVLIIAIAAFNMLSSLVMLVVDKRSDIAIMMALGMRRKTIMRIFMIQGMMIGIIGVIFGLLFGVVISLNVTEIVDCIQKLLNVHFLSSQVYFIDYLPSKLEISDLCTICLIALGMSFLATLYPAWKASRTKPAEALRYE